jgi:hypothetical protein
MLSTTEHAIEQCIAAAASLASDDRRAHQRYPFFRRVTLNRDGVDDCRMTVFCRDVSPGGVGLLHNMPLNTGPVMLHVPLDSGRVLDVHVDIKWCGPGGDTWYLSGGEFLSKSLREMDRLLIEVAKGDAARRSQHRYPFYRPVILTVGAEKTTRSAFGRDISDTGIGLLHAMPLDTGPVMVQFPSVTCDDIGVRTHITWCSPIGDGWYVSGGRFE